MQFIYFYFTVLKSILITPQKNLMIGIITRKLSREQWWLYCTQTIKTKGAFFWDYSRTRVDRMVSFLFFFLAELFHFWIALNSRIKNEWNKQNTVHSEYTE